MKHIKKKKKLAIWIQGQKVMRCFVKRGVDKNVPCFKNKMYIRT